MKVKIIALANEYPTITGVHEFESIEKAIDFARYGANGLHPGMGDRLIIDFCQIKAEGEDYDIEITIYDGYAE